MWVRSKTLQKLVLKAYNHRSANRKCLELISGNFMAALHVLWNFSKFGMVCGLKWSESSKSEQVITVSTKIRDTNGNGNGKSHQVAQMLHKKPRLSAEKLLEIMLAYPPPAILLQKQSWAPNYFVLKVFSAHPALLLESHRWKKLWRKKTGHSQNSSGALWHLQKEIPFTWSGFPSFSWSRCRSLALIWTTASKLHIFIKLESGDPCRTTIPTSQTDKIQSSHHTSLAIIFGHSHRPGGLDQRHAR